jgi:cyclic GMP-AMP synthase DncV-like protein
MQHGTDDLSRLLDVIIDHLDVPKSYYEKAAARHRSLGEWLLRKESRVASFDPDIRPQGSFRFGTVTFPVRAGDEYDLDDVCLLRNLAKTALAQEQLKEIYGEEIKAYARANKMIAPVTEHNRCWRLSYADEVAFHLDTLPCVPDDAAVVQRIAAAGVPFDLARRAVAITDKRHPRYRQVTSGWPSSNPRGFAEWFEQRAALGRRRVIGEGKARAAIEDVPPYEWKTTLQQSIQILKRHRDVTFLSVPDLAPISMIITNLAGQAYAGETDIATALKNIVEKMPDFVRSDTPRVPNPADPAEDYADKWSRDPRLEKNFWEWHTAVKTDIGKMLSLVRGATLKPDIHKMFRVELTEQELRQFEPLRSAFATPVTKTAPIFISSAQKPWGSRA